VSSGCLGLKEGMNWTLILYTVYVFTYIEYEYTDVKGGIKSKELHYLSEFIFKNSRTKTAYISNTLIPVAWQIL